MTLPYHYTSYIWPMLASAAFLAALGVYAWRQRSVPGALPFAIMMLFRSEACGRRLSSVGADMVALLSQLRFWMRVLKA